MQLRVTFVKLNYKLPDLTELAIEQISPTGLCSGNSQTATMEAATWDLDKFTQTAPGKFTYEGITGKGLSIWCSQNESFYGKKMNKRSVTAPQ